MPLAAGALAAGAGSSCSGRKARLRSEGTPTGAIPVSRLSKQSKQTSKQANKQAKQSKAKPKKATKATTLPRPCGGQRGGGVREACWYPTRPTHTHSQPNRENEHTTKSVRRRRRRRRRRCRPRLQSKRSRGERAGGSKHRSQCPRGTHVPFVYMRRTHRTHGAARNLNLRCMRSSHSSAHCYALVIAA